VVDVSQTSGNVSVALETRGLSKHFGAVVAADDISVAIEDGSVVGLIGTNGAGKTTFVNMVTGYLKPSRGSILFRGEDITRRPPRRITRLGIARSFQIPQLYDSLTVRENVLVALGIVARNARASAFVPMPKHVPGYDMNLEQAADHLLERFALGSHRAQAARSLPQGVRKQLDITMAMAGKPSVLLLDEPTSGVAAEEKHAMMDGVLERLRADKVTVLFVEHDMELVSRYAQRVLAFYEGRIIADAAAEEALANAEVRKYVIGDLGEHDSERADA
jgi:branched-chain amino acid transport system ATP-binding protein